MLRKDPRQRQRDSSGVFVPLSVAVILSGVSPDAWTKRIRGSYFAPGTVSLPPGRALTFSKPVTSIFK